MSALQWPLRLQWRSTILLPAPRSPLVCPPAQTESGYRKHWYRELEEMRTRESNSAGLSLTLNYPLADDPRNEGIVWACYPSEHEDIKLVLKIFEYDELVYSSPNDGTVEYPDTTLWAGEEFAFNHVRNQQGKLLPYSYGFYELVLEGTRVCCHLMEEIDGILVDENLFRGSGEHWQQKHWDSLAEAFLQAVSYLHSLDLLHGDLADGNIFILNADKVHKDDDVPQIVLIDWTRAVTISGAKDSPRNAEGKSFWHVVFLKHTLDLWTLQLDRFLGRSLGWLNGSGQTLWQHCYNVMT